ncbi:MAG: hypothetical protein FWG60_00315 [Methanomassiliicoccaceae archaeon]|nr:hypothetical protein [Methanomassiliicoccaceae archaeon]
MSIIDVNHDFWKNYRSDYKDPDQRDPLLRKFHRLLWSKPLPNGKVLTLDERLQHSSELGEFSFSSDSFMNTYLNWKNCKSIIDQIPKNEFEQFYSILSTIGAITIFPSKRIGGNTINVERGRSNGKIGDRMDLTLECIKRHYSGESSPMSDVLERYASFFALFDDFRGYVDFFLMQDMVDDDYNVRFFLKFDDFRSSPLPQNVEEYMEYKENATAFVNSRNIRIKKWAEENL